MSTNKRNEWILCPSNSFPGKFYYFNLTNGKAVWLRNMESTKNSHIPRVTNRCHSYPEPVTPPVHISPEGNAINTEHYLNRQDIPNVQQFTPNIWSHNLPKPMFNANVSNMNRPEFIPSHTWQSGRELTGSDLRSRIVGCKTTINNLNQGHVKNLANQNCKHNFVIQCTNQQKFGQRSELYQNNILQKKNNIANRYPVILNTVQAQPYQYDINIQKNNEYLSTLKSNFQPSHNPQISTQPETEVYQNHLNNVNSFENLSRRNNSNERTNNPRIYQTTSNLAPVYEEDTEDYFENDSPEKTVQAQTRRIVQAKNNNFGNPQAFQLLKTIKTPDLNPQKGFQITNGFRTNLKDNSLNNIQTNENMTARPSFETIYPQKKVQIPIQSRLQSNAIESSKSYGNSTVFDDFPFENLSAQKRVHFTNPRPKELIISKSVGKLASIDEQAERACFDNFSPHKRLQLGPQSAALKSSKCFENVPSIDEHEAEARCNNLNSQKRTQFQIQGNQTYNLNCSKSFVNLKSDNYEELQKQIQISTHSLPQDELTTELNESRNRESLKFIESFGIDKWQKIQAGSQFKNSDVLNESKSVQNFKMPNDSANFEMLQKRVQSNNDELNMNDLRHQLIAKRRKSVDLSDVQPGKKIKTCYTKEAVKESAKKRVTFYDMVAEDQIMEEDQPVVKDQERGKNLDIDSLRALAEPTMNSEHWYLVVDTEILLDHYEFISEYVQLDNKCRLLVPYVVRADIEAMCLGDCAGRQRVMQARQMSRRLSSSPDYISVQAEEVDEDDMTLNESILNCCLIYTGDYKHVVLITNDTDLNVSAKSMDIPCFKLQEIKDGAAAAKPEVTFKLQKTRIVQNERFENDHSEESIEMGFQNDFLNENIEAGFQNTDFNEDFGFKDNLKGNFGNNYFREKYEPGFQNSDVNEKIFKEINNNLCFQFANDFNPFDTNKKYQIPVNMFRKGVFDGLDHNWDNKGATEQKNDDMNMRDLASFKDHGRIKTGNMQKNITRPNLNDANYDTVSIASEMNYINFECDSGNNDNQDQHITNTSSCHGNGVSENSKFETGNTVFEKKYQEEQNAVLQKGEKIFTENNTNNPGSNIASGIRKLSNLNSYTMDVHLKRFYVKNAIVESRVRQRMEEWICCFSQLMEDVLSDVLQNNFLQTPRNLPPPWSVHEATLCIKELYGKHTSIRVVSDKLTTMLHNSSCSKGKLNVSMTPDEFMKIWHCGVLLIKCLKGVLPNSIELVESEKSLIRLLRSIEDPSTDCEAPFPHDLPIRREKSNLIRNRRQNYTKEPHLIIEYLKKHYASWQNVPPEDFEPKMQKHQMTTNIHRDTFKNLMKLNKTDAINKPTDVNITKPAEIEKLNISLTRILRQAKEYKPTAVRNINNNKIKELDNTNVADQSEQNKFKKDKALDRVGKSMDENVYSDINIDENQDYVKPVDNFSSETNVKQIDVKTREKVDKEKFNMIGKMTAKSNCKKFQNTPKNYTNGNISKHDSDGKKTYKPKLNRNFKIPFKTSNTIKENVYLNDTTKPINEEMPNNDNNQAVSEHKKSFVAKFTTSLQTVDNAKETAVSNYFTMPIRGDINKSKIKTMNQHENIDSLKKNLTRKETELYSLTDIENKLSSEDDKALVIDKIDNDVKNLSTTSFKDNTKNDDTSRLNDISGRSLISIQNDNYAKTNNDNAQCYDKYAQNTDTLAENNDGLNSHAINDTNHKEYAQQAYLFAKSFLTELSETFIMIYHFISASLHELRSRKLEDKRIQKLHAKASNAYSVLLRIIDHLKRIIVRECEETTSLTAMLKKADIDTGGDVRMKRYRHIITKCLEQANILRKALRIMTNITGDNLECEINGSLSSGIDYFNIYE